jgi:ankyrin repeat protein
MPLNKKLIEAAKKDDLGFIKSHFNTEKSRLSPSAFNDIDESCMTLLHYACQAGAINTVSFLLENQANVNAVTETCQTPLHYAAVHQDLKIMSMLLNKGALVNKRNINGSTALHIAVASGSVGGARCLIVKEANVNERDGDNCTPLHLLCKSGFDRKIKIEMADLLIERGQANLDLTIIREWQGFYSVNLSDFAQLHHSPSIADLIDEKKRQRSIQQELLQNKVTELEKTVAHLEKKLHKLAMPKHADEKSAEANDSNAVTLFGMKSGRV